MLLNFADFFYLFILFYFIFAGEEGGERHAARLCRKVPQDRQGPGQLDSTDKHTHTRFHAYCGEVREETLIFY